MTLQNDTLLRALLRQPTEYTPVWLMRQAGRYLPEYNATRRRAGSFLGLAKSPAYATEVTLQPVERFPLDTISPRRTRVRAKPPDVDAEVRAVVTVGHQSFRMLNAEFRNVCILHSALHR